MTNIIQEYDLKPKILLTGILNAVDMATKVTITVRGQFTNYDIYLDDEDYCMTVRVDRTHTAIYVASSDRIFYEPKDNKFMQDLVKRCGQRANEKPMNEQQISALEFFVKKGLVK